MKRALVCGATGFIGSYLVDHLIRSGYYVRGVGSMNHFPSSFNEMAWPDEFFKMDLRDAEKCKVALSGGFDEVYQLAADMGGIGFITSSECEVMRNNALINLNVIEAAREQTSHYFFASSACVYRDLPVASAQLDESDAYPALPDNEYGWEKLFSERLTQTYQRRYGLAIRIGRLQSCYGVGGSWDGGREKAIAALCRKIAEASSGGVVEVWGEGSAIRSFLYVSDMVKAIFALMQSTMDSPVNIGSEEYITIDDLVTLISSFAKKPVQILHNLTKPTGVHSRNFSNEKIYSIGWRPRITLPQGISLLYPWIVDQVMKRNSFLSKAKDA